jgi:hypothetical protein
MGRNSRGLGGMKKPEDKRPTGLVNHERWTTCPNSDPPSSPCLSALRRGQRGMHKRIRSGFRAEAGDVVDRPSSGQGTEAAALADGNSGSRSKDEQGGLRTRSRLRTEIVVGVCILGLKTRAKETSQRAPRALTGTVTS